MRKAAPPPPIRPTGCWISAQGLTVEWIVDTHPHADHLSAAQYLKARTGAPTATGSHVTKVQALWQGIYHWPELDTDGRQWDRLLHDGETFTLGELTGHILYSPGHTLASITWVIGDAAFVHDTLFQPDFGTARADFPGGDARMLWDSIGRILALPDDTRLFTGHDYMPGGRAPCWESSVRQQRETNVHLIDGMTCAHYCNMRQRRDRELPMPGLMLPALQVNILGGRLPEPEANGQRYLKIQLNALGPGHWQ